VAVARARSTSPLETDSRSPELNQWASQIKTMRHELITFAKINGGIALEMQHDPDCLSPTDGTKTGNALAIVSSCHCLCRATHATAMNPAQLCSVYRDGNAQNLTRQSLWRVKPLPKMFKTCRILLRRRPNLDAPEPLARQTFADNVQNM
jgi:hypothetical protein